MADRTPTGQSDAERAFRLLVEQYLDGALSAEGMAELDALLIAKPALRRVFVDICRQDQAIYWMTSPNAGKLMPAARAAEPLPGLGEEDPSDDSDADVMASLVEEALRARRLREVESAASAALAQSNADGDRLSQRRAAALRSNHKSEGRSLPIWAVWGSLAAALLLAAWLGSMWTGGDGAEQPGDPVVVEQDETPRFAGNPAYIRRGLGARWSGPDASRRLLKAGTRMTLEAGVAEVLFADGARVIVQGPATFEPTGSAGMRLISGRIVASSGAGGSGFRVMTEASEVTDLGGAFGVSVNRAGVTRTDVIRGEVAVVGLGQDPRERGRAHTVAAGSGAVASSSGVSVVASDLSELVGEAEFDARVASASGGAYERWLAESYRLRRDRDVVAYYVFDASDESAGYLQNQSLAAEGASPGRLGNGAEIATPRWTAGRFAQGRALRFGTAPGGRTYGVVVPDSNILDLDSEMTIAVWVRGDQAAALQGTLLSKREVPPNRMNYQVAIMPSWLSGGAELQFGAGRDDASVRGFVYSPRSGRLSAGSWHHVVFASDGNTVSYYIDGERVHTERQNRAPLTNQAPLLIGTSATGGGQSFFDIAIPFLGEIGEVLIAKRAISASEVRRLYQNSRGD